MNPKLKADEARVLRRESRGQGNLVRLGFIEITDKGRQWLERDRKKLLEDKGRAGRIARGSE